jgi:hypothetical protein
MLRNEATDYSIKKMFVISSYDCVMLNGILNGAVSDTTGDDSSSDADNEKIKIKCRK